MALWRAVITITNSALGGSGTNTFHIRQGSPLGTAAGEAENIMGWIKDFYDACSGMFQGGTAFRYDGTLEGVGPNIGNTLDTPPWESLGTAGAATLPPFVSLCVNWMGEVGDRSKRGRTFLGPIAPEACGANGRPDPADLVTVRAAAANLVEESDSFDDGAVGIWSRQESLFRDVVGSAVANQFASLTSRRD